MSKKISASLKLLIPKLGKTIKTERELSDAFINGVIKPHLVRKFGIAYPALLERTIKRGRYDFRVGGLVVEFEKPFKDISEGIEQGRGYIAEFKEKGLTVECFVTNGEKGAILDSEGQIVKTGETIDLALDLQNIITVAAPKVIEPEDLLKVFGPESDLCMAHVKNLLELFRQYKKSTFIHDSYDLWKRVYGAAANINEPAEKAVKTYAGAIGIELTTTENVEEFVFVVETYLSIFMKLLVAKIVVQQKLVQFTSLEDLLGSYPVLSYERLADKMVFIKSAFAHDSFNWFVDPCKASEEPARIVSNIISHIAIALDKIDLTTVKIDLLRRVYQRFFDRATRRALGEFYTNEELVGEVLKAVGYEGSGILEKTLLDPTCGSGTFLIVAIKKFLVEARKKKLDSGEILKRISDQIVGIDVHPFAVAMARVNYLIATSKLLNRNILSAVGEFKLPIYWSDSLAEFIESVEPTGAPVIRVDASPLGKFVLPTPTKISWEVLFSVLARAIERNWTQNRFLQQFPEELRLTYSSTLGQIFKHFKRRSERGGDSRWLPTLHNLFVVHELHHKCDFVVGNPPWVRIHTVGEELRNRVKKRYKFYGKGADWNPKFLKLKVTFGKPDYSMAFVEASFDFLREGGNFGFVITSNIIRALYAGKLRESLLNNTTLIKIADYSLSKLKLFEEAQNAPLILAFKNLRPNNNKVMLDVVNRSNNRLSWSISQNDLSITKVDPKSPWMISPPKIVKIIRKMQKKRARLGDIVGVAMGCITAANSIFFVRDFKPTDVKGVVLAETLGDEKVKIERGLLRPLVRGRNVDEWRFEVENYIIWTHDDDGVVLKKLPPHATNYFDTNRGTLVARKTWQVSAMMEEGAPFWVIGNADKAVAKGKIAWQEIAKKIEAVSLPSTHKDRKLGNLRLIVDHKLFFLESANENVGLALTAFLNSVLANAFAATIVTRTGAEYCNFSSWVIGLLPVDSAFVDTKIDEVVDISEKLHELKGQNDELLKELDRAVAKVYGLSDTELGEMLAFYAFFTD